MKVAILVLSDPNSGTDESLGRVFNALASAYDFKQSGDEVSIIFQGAGSRWIEALTKTDHPAHKLFEAVKDMVSGVSCACADVFGARESVTASGYGLIAENLVPGTSGLPSLSKLFKEGYTILTF
jgi:hypothetical protein